MKRKTIHCPYCGAKATLHPSRYVYGDANKNNGFVYACDRYPRCDSYVSAHQKSRLPMGTLANGDLRNKRIQAHKAFDWTYEEMAGLQMDASHVGPKRTTSAYRQVQRIHV